MPPAAAAAQGFQVRRLPLRPPGAPRAGPALGPGGGLAADGQGTTAATAAAIVRAVALAQRCPAYCLRRACPIVVPALRHIHLVAPGTTTSAAADPVVRYAVAAVEIVELVDGRQARRHEADRVFRAGPEKYAGDVICAHTE